MKFIMDKSSLVNENTTCYIVRKIFMLLKYLEFFYLIQAKPHCEAHVTC